MRKRREPTPDDSALMLSIVDESRTIQMPQLDKNRPTQKVKLMQDIDEGNPESKENRAHHEVPK